MSSHTIPLVTAEHPLQAVTIFQSSTAQLTRAFTVNLKVRYLYLYVARSNHYLNLFNRAEVTSSRSLAYQAVSTQNRLESTA